ncbi:MAG: hypothetical protein ACTHKF_01620, partial [Candidatus Nitrosocosmicus sp.]
NKEHLLKVYAIGRICNFLVHPKQQIWSKYYLFYTQSNETIFIDLEVDSEKSQENHDVKIRKISEFVVNETINQVGY